MGGICGKANAEKGKPKMKPLKKLKDRRHTPAELGEDAKAVQAYRLKLIQEKQLAPDPVVQGSSGTPPEGI